MQINLKKLNFIPQMSPMNWLFLMILNFVNFFCMLMFLYYVVNNFFILNIELKEKIKNNYFIFVW